MNARVMQQIALETDLRRALERDQFVLYYQPRIDARNGHAVGFAALLRWCQHAFGVISPATFIPILEETNRTIPAGHWSVQEAARQCAARRRNTGRPLRIALNRSDRQFDLPELLPAIRRAVVAEGVERARHVEMLRAMGCASLQGFYYGRPFPTADATGSSRRRRFRNPRFRLDSGTPTQAAPGIEAPLIPSTDAAPIPATFSRSLGRSRAGRRLRLIRFGRAPSKLIRVSLHNIQTLRLKSWSTSE